MLIFALLLIKLLPSPNVQAVSATTSNQRRKQASIFSLRQKPTRHIFPSPPVLPHTPSTKKEKKNKERKHTCLALPGFCATTWCVTSVCLQGAFECRRKKHYLEASKPPACLNLLIISYWRQVTTFITRQNGNGKKRKNCTFTSKFGYSSHSECRKTTKLSRKVLKVT